MIKIAIMVNNHTRTFHLPAATKDLNGLEVTLYAVLRSSSVSSSFP